MRRIFHSSHFHFILVHFVSCFFSSLVEAIIQTSDAQRKMPSNAFKMCESRCGLFSSILRFKKNIQNKKSIQVSEAINGKGIECVCDTVWMKTQYIYLKKKQIIIVLSHLSKYILDKMISVEHTIVKKH